MRLSEHPTLFEQRQFLIDVLVRVVSEIVEARSAASGNLPCEFSEPRQRLIEEAYEALKLFDETHPEIVEAMRAEAWRLTQERAERDGEHFRMDHSTREEWPRTVH